MSNRNRHRDTSGIWKIVLVIGAAAIVGVLVIAALTTTTPTTPAPVASTPMPEPTVEQEPEPEPEGVVIVGDSNTEVNSPDFARGQIGDGTWAYSTLRSSGYYFAGGWAVSGSTSVDQAEGLEEVEDADVLVIMTGTNDLSQGVPFEDTVASLDTMTEKVPTERVVVLAIAPLDNEGTPTTSEFNQSLEALAADRGWEFFDALEFLRSPDGGFAEGTSDDGRHFDTDSHRELGRAVAEYLGE